MKENNFEKLIEKIKSEKLKIILFGAGTLGKMAIVALNKLDIIPDCFCDSDKKKQGTKYCGFDVISPEELFTYDKKTQIFLCNNYIDSILPILRTHKFENISNCVDLLEQSDFTDSTLNIDYIKIKRQISLHKGSCIKRENINSDKLNMKYVDIVITERCSLKCKDCSNLMQYYSNPKNTDLKVLFGSLDRFMKCVDWLCEFRVIGGEPFMNQNLFKIIKKLVSFNNVDNAVIYSNGTIIPKDENLSCLKLEKVTLDITNYHKNTKRFTEIIEILKRNNISFVTNDVSQWNDCGKIEYHERNEKILKKMFLGCCVNDVMTLLHKKLYRCPFSAHATNLKAIPYDECDVVDLYDDKMDIELLKIKIKNLYNNKKYLSACHYCYGRDFNSKEIEPAIQTKYPLKIERKYE